MKCDYVKTLLYSYEHLPKIIKRIDEIVLKRALGSMTNFSFCVKQCEKIVNLTIQKALMLEAKYYLDRAMSRLDLEEKEMLEYKYFRMDFNAKPVGFDYTSRNYFRKQQKLVKDIGDNLGWLNKGDEWFEKRCLKVPFLRKLYYAVKRKDESFLISGKFRVNEKKSLVA